MNRPCRPAARAAARAGLALLAALPFAAPAWSASADNNVEWNGLSHVGWQDRRPLCPVAGETFQVRFQAYRNDLTAARVQLDDGGAPVWIDAAVVDTRGPYDIWAAQVPATASGTPSYFLELTDGTDVDYLSVNGVTDGTPGDGGFALDFATLAHAPVGATPATGGTVFKVWSPATTAAHVRGEFNGWGTGNPMTRSGVHWTAFVPGTTDRQMYKYFFNNSVWNSDARARSLNPSNSYNAHLEDPFRYTWTSGAYQTPPLEEMVIYQLHVGTFAGRNDPLGSTAFPSTYQDVAARVGHLAELGVNAVMLNPVTEFPGDLSAGYNPITAWAPEWKYGTPDDFKALVDACHANGIAVLLDIVWNHMSSTDNYLWFYDGSQIYFDSPAVGTPWGDQCDFDAAEVADYYADSALYWLEEFRLDGFRMDATDFMNMGVHGASGWALMQRFNDEIDNRFVDRVAIAEQLPDDSFVTRPTSLSGAGFDSQYHDAFTDQIRQEVFDAAFSNAEMWRIQNIINGSGVDISGSKALNYVELHDEAWPTSGGQRIVKTIDTTAPHDDAFARGRSMMAQGITLLAPGVPAILMGTEWLEDTDFGTDAVTRLDWSHKTLYADVFAYYRDIIALRTGEAAFHANSAHSVIHLNETSDVVGFTRSDGQGGDYLVIASFNNNDLPGYRIGVPSAGTWSEVLNSQDAAYGGNGTVNPGAISTEAVSWNGFNQSIVLTVPQMGLVVLRDDTGAVSAVPGADTGPGLVFANPMSAAGNTFSFAIAEAGRVRLDLLDAGGRRVATLEDGIRRPGAHSVTWDGTVEGRPAPAGVYFVRLETAGEVLSRKLTVLR